MGLVITIISICLCAYGAYVNLATNFRADVNNSPGDDSQSRSQTPTKTGSVFDISTDREVQGEKQW